MRVPGAALLITGLITRGDHPRDENGNIVKGDFEDQLSGPNLNARFAKAGLSLVGITDDAIKGNAAAAALIVSAGLEIGEAVAAFINEYIKEDFVRDIILISSVSENFRKMGFKTREEMICSYPRCAKERKTN